MYSVSQFTPVADKYGASRRGQQQDQSLTYTNHKSYSINKSTQFGSKTPNKSLAVSRLEDARRTIDEVIVDLSEKRDMNEQALREIRSVNSEIVEDFRKSQYTTKEKTRKPSVTYQVDCKSAQASTKDLRGGQEEGIVLRSRLNEELKKNNELISKLARLEDQNKFLKRDQQMSFGPSSENGQLRMENQRLKQRISELSQIPEQIFSEIDELKKQNQLLRGDTIRLLRKVQQF